MLEVTLFTDPACPFAFSAEPARWRLRWQYGDGLRWTTRMIVLTREDGEAEKLAGGADGLQAKYGMPIARGPHARAASSEPACRAVVAARVHGQPARGGTGGGDAASESPKGGDAADASPVAGTGTVTDAAGDGAAGTVTAASGDGPADRLLRGLRVRLMAGEGLLDEQPLIDAAARDAGLDPAQLQAWCATDATAAALESDAAAARDPLPAARALDHKLGGPPHERRYTAPSYLFGGVAIPGFNPIETYEAAIANLDPALPRRPGPAGVRELLDWAGVPLATAEVAAVLQTSIEDARDALNADAERHPAGADAYWT